MTTIPPLSEALRNQVLAALDERIARLEREISQFEFYGTNTSEDGQRAYVWSVDALLQCNQAREVIGEAGPTPEQADDMTAAKAYHDWQAAGPVA